MNRALWIAFTLAALTAAIWWIPFVLEFGSGWTAFPLGMSGYLILSALAAWGALKAMEAGK